MHRFGDTTYQRLPKTATRLVGKKIISFCKQEFLDALILWRCGLEQGSCGTIWQCSDWPERNHQSQHPCGKFDDKETTKQINRWRRATPLKSSRETNLWQTLEANWVAQLTHSAIALTPHFPSRRIPSHGFMFNYWPVSSDTAITRTHTETHTHTHTCFYLLVF